MAGISQQISPDDVLPLVARNAYATGYLNGVPTEYLRLVDRYLHQARELQMLAGSSGTIHVANCAEAEPLLSILGYHARPACGQKDSTLMTADPERAFLTTDSGFPLTALEEALEKGDTFTYAFPSSRVPVLFSENDWKALSSAKSRGAQSLVDILLHEPAVDRLYWALANTDAETRNALATLARPGQTSALWPGSRFLRNPDLHSRRPRRRARRNLRRSGLERTGGRQPKVAGGLCPSPGRIQTTGGWRSISTPCRG